MLRKATALVIISLFASSILAPITATAQRNGLKQIRNIVDSPTCGLRISVLTASSGLDLYSAWGHTAMRVIDSSTRADITYNYGTFNVYDPDFYMKFTRGQLLYCLSRYSFYHFLPEYREENRAVIEQVLNLSCEEKHRLRDALEANYQGADSCYLYDFAKDNCTTRVRDMVASVKPGFQTKNLLPEGGTTVRDMIHTDLDRLGMHWTRLGIDILLGSPIDQKLDNKQFQFLPASLARGLDSSSAMGKPIVAETLTLIDAAPATNGGVFLTPALAFSALFLLVVVLYFSRGRWAKILLGVADFLLFFMTGLTGLFLLFMWFGTDHAGCRNNWNLLWAFPLHSFAAFLLHSPKNSIKIYWRSFAIVYVSLLLVWFFLPQELNPSLIPLIILLAWRSWSRSSSN